MMHKISLSILFTLLSALSLLGQKVAKTELTVGDLIISLPSEPKVQKSSSNETFTLKLEKGHMMGTRTDLSQKPGFQVSKDSLRFYYKDVLAKAKVIQNAPVKDVEYIKLGKYEGVYYSVTIPAELPENRITSYNLCFLIGKNNYTFSYFIPGSIEGAAYTKEEFVKLIRLKE